MHEVIDTVYSCFQPIFPYYWFTGNVDVGVIPEGLILHFWFGLRYIQMVAGPSYENLSKQREFFQ